MECARSKSFDSVNTDCFIDLLWETFISLNFVLICRSKWQSNPHFRGSYTNVTLESDALGATTTKLAEPINDQNGKPILQFAGEATNQHHFSTVHGAIESGWREAQRLIDLYR